MKKMVIILGGPVNLFEKDIGLFKEFEKQFKTKVIKTSKLKFNSDINGTKIEFLFAYCPKRDAAYLNSKRYIERNYHEKVPLPAEELCKKIKKANIVLFFGTCGAFKGKREQVYTPTKFREINYSGTLISIKEFKKNLSKEIKFNNILFGLGKDAVNITSNQTLMPHCVEGKKEEKIIQLGTRLTKWGEIVDKESYQIVKNLKGKFNLGIGLVCTDVLLFRQFLTPKHNFGFKDKFNKFVLSTIKRLVITNF